MRLNEEQAWERVVNASHGYLSTLHPERGIDSVPVVFAVDADRRIFLPVDTVKPKTTTALRRIENIRLDPRCTLLVDHYESDWSRLWWARLHCVAMEAVAEDIVAFSPLLAARYPQYETAGTVVGGMVLTATTVTGWAAQ